MKWVFPCFVLALAAFVRCLTTSSDASGSSPILGIGLDYGLTESSIPNLQGLVMVITGASSGLGKGTATVLARHGAKVIITARSDEKCKMATSEIVADAQNGMDPGRPATILECFVVELSSLSSVSKFTKDVIPVLKQLGGLHSLILNAGVMSPPFQATDEGLEWQFGVNYLSHFMIARDLTDLLLASSPSTVVSVSSIAHLLPHYAGNIEVLTNISAINDQDKYEPRLWYGYSKLANIYFASEFNRRYKRESLYANAVHPGAVKGHLMRHELNRLPYFLKTALNLIVDYLFWDEEVASLTSIFASIQPIILAKKSEAINGKYFIPIARPYPLKDFATNETVSAGLWQLADTLLEEHGY